MKTSKLPIILAILFISSLIFSCSSGYRITRRYVEVEPIIGQEKCELIIFNDTKGIHNIGYIIRVDDTIYGYIIGKEHFKIDHYTGNRVLILEQMDLTHYTSERIIELQKGQNIYNLKIKSNALIVERLDSLPPRFDPYREKIPTSIKVDGIKIEKKPKVKWYSL